MIASLVALNIHYRSANGANVQISSSLSLLFGMIKLQGSMAVQVGRPGDNAERPAPQDETLRINCSQGFKDSIVRFLDAQATRDPAAIPTWQLSPQKAHQPSPHAASEPHARTLAALMLPMPPPLADAKAADAAWCPLPPPVPAPAAPLTARAAVPPPPPASPPSGVAAVRAPKAVEAAADGGADREPDPSTPPASKPPVGLPPSEAAAAVAAAPPAKAASATAVRDSASGSLGARPAGPPAAAAAPPAAPVAEVEAAQAKGAKASAAAGAAAVARTAAPMPPAPAAAAAAAPNGKHPNGQHANGQHAANGQHHQAPHHHAHHLPASLHNPAFLATLGPDSEAPALDHSSFMSLMAHAGTYKPSIALESAAAAAALAARAVGFGSPAAGAGGGAPLAAAKPQAQQPRAAVAKGGGKAAKSGLKKSPESLLGLRDIGIEGWTQSSRDWERTHAE